MLVHAGKKTEDCCHTARVVVKDEVGLIKVFGLKEIDAALLSTETEHFFKCL